MPLFPFLLVSAGSVTASMATMIWLTAGGFFRIAYGHAQIWYFSVVAVAIVTALCAARYFQLRAPAMIVTCVLGGYVGSVIFYSGFDFFLIVRDLTAGNYFLLITPFIFPFHLIFVLAGLCAGLLVLTISRIAVTGHARSK